MIRKYRRSFNENSRRIQRNRFSRLHENDSFAEKIDIMSLSKRERASLILQVWNDRQLSKRIKSTNDYYDYFEEIGYDTSDYDSQIFDEDWELACSVDESDNPELYQDEEEYDDIRSKEDAWEWLKDMHRQYGSAYFFPEHVKNKLNKLTVKFGNTYFWHR